LQKSPTVIRVPFARQTLHCYKCLFGRRALHCITLHYTNPLLMIESAPRESMLIDRVRECAKT